MGTIVTTEKKTEPLIKNETCDVDSITVDSIINYSIVLENNKKDYLETFEKISKHVPNGEQQLDAVKSFFEGKMSYAEMRMRAG